MNACRIMILKDLLCPQYVGGTGLCMTRPLSYQLSSIEQRSTLSRTMATQSCEKCLTMDNMNPCVKEIEYAVRGPIPTRSLQIEKELKAGAKKPFKEVTKANIGDCHAMGQVPITYIRQVLAAVSYPEIMKTNLLPKDVIAKAQQILSGCKGSSVGSYSDSPGIELIRRHVAEYIESRDNQPSNWEDVILCAGASDGIKCMMKLLVKQMDGKKPGVMIPIPQYPLYSATLSEFNMHQIGYYLKEENNWSLEISELERALKEAKTNSVPRALVVINPGNPTGQVLTRKNIEDIIKFAKREKLFLFSDEVYQDNVYDPNSRFYSMKKVMKEMGPPYSEMELASFMSCSKGYMGECGLRGGYYEVINLDSNVRAMLHKLISAMLCPTVLGQTAMDCVVRPPMPGEESYELFMKEKNSILKSLNGRAKLVADSFNSFEGFSCQTVQGAMYAFPRLELPAKAIEKAKSLGQAPDVFYAFQLLEQTGICVVPGTGFGQKAGTYHFRTTILPQPDTLKEMMQTFRKFHEKFVEEYK